MPDRNPKASGDTVEEKREVYLLNTLKKDKCLQNRLHFYNLHLK